MNEASSPDVSEQKKADNPSASETQPVPFSGSMEPEQSDGQALDLASASPTSSASQKSFWAKTKDALNEVSTQASSAGGALTSKALKLGTSAASKSAEIAKQTHSASANATRAALEASKQAYTGSKLESAVNYIDAELDQRGAKQAIKGTTEAVIGKLDQVTGKRLLELLEEKLVSQDAYNDILATRLAEALERIARLEIEFANFMASAPTLAPSPGPVSNTGEIRNQQ